MTHYPCRHDGFRIRLMGALAVVTVVTTIYIKIMEKADTMRVTKEAYRNAYLYKNENRREMLVSHESGDGDFQPNKRNEFKYRGGKQARTKSNSHSKEAAGGVTRGRGATGREQSPTVGDDSQAGESSLPEVITLPDVKSLLGDDGMPDGGVTKRRGTRPRGEGREAVMGQSTPGKRVEASEGGSLLDGYHKGSLYGTKNTPAGESVLRGRIVQEVNGVLQNETVSDGILAKRDGIKTRIVEREQAFGHSTSGKEGNSSMGGGLFEVYVKTSPIGAKREPGGNSVLGTKRDSGGNSVLGAKSVPGGDRLLVAKRVSGGDRVIGAKRKPGGNNVLGAKIVPGGESVLGAKSVPGGDRVLGAKSGPGGVRVLGGEMVQVGHDVLKKETIPDGVLRGSAVTGGGKVTGKGTLQGGHGLPRKGIKPGYGKSLGKGGAGSGSDSVAGGGIATKGSGGHGIRILPGHEVVLEMNNVTDVNSVKRPEILPEDERVIGIVPGDTVPTRIVTAVSIAGMSPSLPNGRRSTADKNNGGSDDLLRDSIPDTWGYSGVGNRSEDVIVPSDDAVRKGTSMLLFNTALDRLLKDGFVTPVPLGLLRADYPRYEITSVGGRVQGVNGVSAGSLVPGTNDLSAGSQVPGTNDLSAGSQVPGTNGLSVGSQVPGTNGLSAGSQVPGTKGLSARSQVPGSNGVSGERMSKSGSDSLRSREIKNVAPRVSLRGGAHKVMADIPDDDANVHGVVDYIHDEGFNVSVGDGNIPSRSAHAPENINAVFGAGKIMPVGGIEAEGSVDVPGGVQVVSRNGTNLQVTGTRVSGPVVNTSSEAITSRKAISSSEDGNDIRSDKIISGNYVPDKYTEPARNIVPKGNNAPVGDYIPGNIIQQKLKDQERDTQVGKLKQQQKERTLTEQVLKENIAGGHSVPPGGSIMTPLSTSSNLTIKNMSNTDLLSAISGLLSHVDIPCHRIQNYTGLFGGVWFLCDDPGVSIEPPCQMYSFSVQADLALDAAVAEERKCTVTSNDPNLESAKALNRSAPILSAANQHVHHPRRAFTSQDFEAKLGRNRTSVDVIKMDVDGLEWGAIPRLIASGQLSGVRQLIVQFHVYNTRHGHLLRKLQCLQALEKAGFKKFATRFRGCQQFINESYFNSKCYDVGFLRL